MLQDVEKVYIVLELVNEKSSQLEADELIPVSLLRLARSGLSRADIMDIMAMLWKDDRRSCIEIIQWPDMENFFTNKNDDFYYVKKLANFHEVFYKYSEYAAYAKDPVQAQKLYPRKDLNADSIIKLMTQDPANLDRNYAGLLSFERISSPMVNVDGERYLFSAMRSGKAFEIVSYCISHSPEKDVLIEELKQQLKITGISNIKAALQNSRFDTSKGELRMFVDATPSSIKVSRSALITEKQLQAIKSAAKTLT